MVPIVPSRIRSADIRPGIEAGWRGDRGGMLGDLLVAALTAIGLAVHPLWLGWVILAGALLDLGWIIATGVRATRDARDFATYIDSQYPANGLGVPGWTAEEIDYLDGVRRLFGNQHGEADL